MPHRHLDHLKQTALAYAVLYFNGRMPTSPGSKKATRTLKDDEAIAWLLEYYAKREDYYGQKENTATDYREKTRYGRRKEASKKIVEKLGKTLKNGLMEPFIHPYPEERVKKK